MAKTIDLSELIRQTLDRKRSIEYTSSRRTWSIFPRVGCLLPEVAGCTRYVNSGILPRASAKWCVAHTDVITAEHLSATQSHQCFGCCCNRVADM
jgi:hypothetical protein